MKDHQLKLILPETEHYRAEAIDWLFLDEKASLIVYIRSFHPNVFRNDYYLLFKEVISYHFTKYRYFNERRILEKKREYGVLYEIADNFNAEDYRTFVSLQVPFLSSLEVIAKSYTLHDPSSI